METNKPYAQIFNRLNFAVDKQDKIPRYSIIEPAKITNLNIKEQEVTRTRKTEDATSNFRKTPCECDTETINSRSIKRAKETSPGIFSVPYFGRHLSVRNMLVVCNCSLHPVRNLRVCAASV